MVEKVGVKYERSKREIGGIYQAFGKAVLHKIIDVAADSLIS
jgi:hypothetical protein